MSITKTREVSAYQMSITPKYGISVVSKKLKLCWMNG